MVITVIMTVGAPMASYKSVTIFTLHPSLLNVYIAFFCSKDPHIADWICVLFFFNRRLGQGHFPLTLMMPLFGNTDDTSFKRRPSSWGVLLHLPLVFFYKASSQMKNYQSVPLYVHTCLCMLRSDDLAKYVVIPNYIAI